MNFIVSIKVNFGDVLTGGVLVLHKLAYEIARRGHKVTIFTKPEYPHPNIIVKEDSSENELNFEYNPNETVIIPSFDWKNNSDIKHVSRWALYHIGPELMSNVDPTDEIFNFGSFEIYGVNSTKKLTTFDYQKNIFINKNQNREKRYCHLLLKNNPPNAHELISYFDSFDLSDYKSKGCFEYLSEKFNEYEYFLTFDDKTFLTLAAAMCGCKPIILNTSVKRPLMYRMENPLQMFGVAYGFRDLTWCDNTLDYVPEYVDYLEMRDNETIDEFINFWKKKLKNEIL